MNRAEPCALDKKFGSIVISRISVVDRPSLRLPLDRICSRNAALKRSSITAFISFPCSGYDSSKNSRVEVTISSFAPERACLSSIATIVSIWSPTASSIEETSSGLGSGNSNSSFITLSSPTSSFWRPIISRMVSWATFRASSTVASDASLASPSTMTTVSSLPETINSKSQSSCSVRVGLITILPSSFPTRTEAMGPFQGIVEAISAAEAPTPARTSAIFSPSLCRTVIMTWVSFLKPFGNNGLKGLSVKRLVKTSCSDGLASRLKNPPGIFPPA